MLTEQEELLAMEQLLRRKIAAEKEEIEWLQTEIVEIQRWDSVVPLTPQSVAIFPPKLVVNQYWFIFST